MDDTLNKGGLYHWTDTSLKARQARKRLRDNIRLGFDKPKASDEGGLIDAELHPAEYFKCRMCGDGPWHITWGGICPNCSGAD